MPDYLELACQHLDVSMDDVLSSRVYEAEGVITLVVNRGIKGCPKYRIPLSELVIEEDAPDADGEGPALNIGAIQADGIYRPDIPVDEVSEAAGVGHLTDALKDAGFRYASDIRRAYPSSLTVVSGVGKVTAEKLKAAAAELLEAE